MTDRRSSVACVAAFAASALAGVCLASGPGALPAGDATAPADGSGLYLSTAAAQSTVPVVPAGAQGGGPAAAEAAPSDRPLMSVLDRLGLAQSLRNAGIDVRGYVEGSYTKNFGSGSTLPGIGPDVNTFRFFDTETDVPLLNQVSLIVEREVNPTGKNWDVGFRVNWIYGSDARFIHANGLNFYGPSAGAGVVSLAPNQAFQPSPENEFDLFEAYADIAVPVGNGLRVRLGKFASFFGSAVDPTQNTFYSHALVFGASRPLSFTGVLGTYPVTDRLFVEGGFARGWNQSLKDSNDAIDALARVTYKVNDRTDLFVSAVTGPENEGDNSHYTTLVEVTLAHRFTDQLRVALDATYGQREHNDIFILTGGDPPTVPGFRDSRYYGLAGYGTYKVNEYVALNGRAEFVRDEQGGLFSGGLFPNLTVYEVTLGMTLTPFPHDALGSNFKLRPEFRWDYGSKAVFDNFSDHSQFTFGVDAIYSF